MIVYQKGCFGLHILARVSGTSWPHGILPGLLSASIGLALGQFQDLDNVVSDEDVFIKNPYPYQLFAYMVGFVLVFRTNFGYTRYWEALDAVQRMAAKWLDGAMMAIVFDAKGDPSLPFLQSSVDRNDSRSKQLLQQALDFSRTLPKDGSPAAAGMDHQEFFVEIVHLFSLMHALALQHLRCDSCLENLESHSEVRDKFDTRLTHLPSGPELTSSNRNLSGFIHSNKAPETGRKLKVLGGLLPEELEKLDCDSEGNALPSVARVTMVESWIMRRMIARQKHEPAGDMSKTAPPILSRMVQVVSDGNLGFSQASKAAETPFPFPYHNLIRMFLWIFVFTVPFIFNAKVMSPPARFVMNFIAVWAYFSLAEASDNLEDPYLPYDPNDLPLEALQHSFNARLLACGVIPMEMKPAHHVKSD